MKADASWPASLGAPASSGSSNDLHYAWFPEKQRLAVRGPGEEGLRVYDTGKARLHGFASKDGKTLGFETEEGPGDLKGLKRVEAH